MNRFVFDTSCWISFFYRGRFERILLALIAADIRVFACAEQLSEFADVHTKHPKVAQMLPDRAKVYLSAIRETSYNIDVRKRYVLTPDYKDNYLVDLAHQSTASLVSNDRDFDILKRFRSPEINVLTIREFYMIIGL